MQTPRQRSGALIRAYREAAGLTCAEMAERAGLSARTLRRYEAGTYALSTDLVLPVALALGLDDRAAQRFAAEVCGLVTPAAAGTRATRAPRGRQAA